MSFKYLGFTRMMNTEVGALAIVRSRAYQIKHRFYGFVITRQEDAYLGATVVYTVWFC